MAALDWIFVALLLASMLMGAWRGLVYEFLSLVGWVVAFGVAQWLADDVAALLPLEQSRETMRYAAGFIVVFVVTVFACGFLAWLGKKLVEAIGLRPVDRTLGAVFGLLRGLVFLLALVVVASLTGLDGVDWWKESRSTGLLKGALKEVGPVLPQGLVKHLPA